MSSSLQDKRFVALEITLRELTLQISKESEISNTQIIKEIKIKSESDIDRILSEPEFLSSFVQSIRQQSVATATNTDQQTTLLLQKPVSSDITPKTAEPKKWPSKRKSDQNVEETITEIQIAEQLKTAHSREEGKAILDKCCKTLGQLRPLAEHLRISGSKKLKKMDLIEKIIQETIGYRIDSKIIQEHKWDK